MKKTITTEQAPQAIGPYAQAIEAGGFLFLSGQIPLVATTGEIVEGGIVEQTKQVLKNIEAVLAAKNLTFADVVKTTIFLVDMNDFTIVNEIYGQAFSLNPPARSCVQVARLPKDVKVEIETIALIK
ncbi:MAG TPA: RidA family protein [Candidatus Avacidaminococcus intestinavium]|uniref:RidA family protein n=1 Tax=Candidatus Avacidaminococcus intestinavium TaxID=2840684 RepID=A0A9D1MPS2_9FIRM|nr:RidA family protein [Candidatus Avacidaminococcus intestinavium]